MDKEQAGAVTGIGPVQGGGGSGGNYIFSD